MANVNHKDLPESELHEPKGVSTASNGTSYVSNGSGSGTWKQAPYKYVLTHEITDFKTPHSHYHVVPIGGTIVKIYSIIDQAFTGSDEIITFKRNGSAIVGATITIEQASSAAGTIDSSIPSSNNVVSEGDIIELIGNGGSTSASSGKILFVIQV